MSEIKLEVTLAKYTYTLEEVPQLSELVGGCYGCFFCRVRGGNLVQTCGNHPKLTYRCYHNRIIYKAVGKRIK